MQDVSPHVHGPALNSGLLEHAPIISVRRHGRLLIFDGYESQMW